MTGKPTKQCRHCTRRSGKCGRGLCWSCWHNESIRNLYPKADPVRSDYYEPTMAELDALIAQQRANLPEWWSKEAGRPSKGIEA